MQKLFITVSGPYSLPVMYTSLNIVRCLSSSHIICLFLGYHTHVSFLLCSMRVIFTCVVYTRPDILSLFFPKLYIHFCCVAFFYITQFLFAPEFSMTCISQVLFCYVVFCLSSESIRGYIMGTNYCNYSFCCHDFTCTFN